MPAEVETMFSAREIPWHGLGTIVAEELSSEEAIKAAGLDWEVTLENVYAGEDNEILIPNLFATVRERKVKGRWQRDALGVVGDRYTIVQNREMFEFSDAVAATGQARYTTAGSLRKGSVVFSTMLIDRPLVVAGDEHLPYMVCGNSHDGSLALTAMVTPIRVVCMNTWKMAISKATHTWSIKHTPNVEERAAEARKALKLTFEYLDGFEAEVKALVAQDMNDRQFNAIMKKVFPEGETELQGKNREGIVESIHQIRASDEVGDFRNTAWGTLNAVNSWELWEKQIRASNHADDPDTLRFERQAMGILKGTEAPITQKTHKLLVAAR